MRPSTVRLTAAAASDFEHILEWTAEHFCESPALLYAETLSLAIEALTEGPSIPGAKQRDEILKGLYSLHVARQYAKNFDCIAIRRSPEHHEVPSLPPLHDSMDLPRHLRDEPAAK